MLHTLAQAYGITVSSLRRSFDRWLRTAPCAQPSSYKDIDLQLPVRGSPFILQQKHVKVIAESVKYFANNNTPLTRPGVREPVRTYVKMLPEVKREKIYLGENGPSDVCLNNMMKRFGVQYQPVKIVENQRITAINPSTPVGRQCSPPCGGHTIGQQWPWTSTRVYATASTVQKRG